MPSQFFGLNIGASALSSFQTSVNTTANNIANVQTKGYTRQTTTLQSTDPIRVYMPCTASSPSSPTMLVSVLASASPLVLPTSCSPLASRLLPTPG